MYNPKQELRNSYFCVNVRTLRIHSLLLGDSSLLTDQNTDAIHDCRSLTGQSLINISIYLFQFA